MINDKYTARIKKQNKNLKKYRCTSNILSIIRLIVISTSVYFTYIFVKTNYKIVYLILCSILYAVFICLIIYHKRIKNKISFSKEIVNINNMYLDRINGNWINFTDTGKEFINKRHRYSYDLDIVGEKSLFQLINLTNTYYGRKILAEDLLNPQYDKNEIKSRQEAIEELSNKLDFCQSLQAVSKKHRIKLVNPNKLISYAENKESSIKSTHIRKFIYALPVFTVPLSFLIILFQYKKIYIVVAAIIVQCLIWLIGFLKNNKILESVRYLKHNLDTYYNILKLLEKQQFNSKKLNNIREILFNESSSSISGIKELNSISERINLRYNSILYMILNGLFLWDYQCVFSLENWKYKYGFKVKVWLKAIGEVESLMSLSTLISINEKTYFPVIDNSRLMITAKELGHPLINSNKRVLNDIDLQNNIFIITGSNMSGKTTFLRTVGINLVLAYSGAPVCSSQMTCSILNIFTSMRITDDLKNGISTFYAELVRIKDIINYVNCNKDKNIIFLIDEIFRGTNSKDRILGAKNVLANLNALGAIGIITTHDLELCSLDKNYRIKNYNFSEYYKGNKIFFDYKIKQGKSITTNAKYLMKKVGIKILEE